MVPLILCMVALGVEPGRNAVAEITPDNAERLLDNVSPRASESTLWDRVKGRRARNAILLGKWSHHILGSGEFFGDGTHDERHYLLGIQCGGLAFGTFINCYDNRTFFAGLAREIGSASYSANTRVDAGYKVGLMHGYGRELPNLCGISPQLMLTLGLSWRRLGLDLGFTPVVASLNFRIDLE